MKNLTNNQASLTPSSNWKITYNARFTLTFCLISLALLLLNIATGGFVNKLFALRPDLSLFGFYRSFTYILCHANFAHFIGNVLFLLLLGPMLEEKYGSKILTIMTLITAVSTGLVNALLFNDSIIGASGIVFMFIVLSSIVNMKQKEIPLTFVFVVIIYLGGEVVDSFNHDNISQFGHIVGGLCGAGLGYFFNRNS
ncbi:MAG: rhomboid family intramembrane serine protease [Flavobacteriales bacterium]|nr:rhomboid family intramembrane serine protease [Flavobacteriales bacterium]